MFYVYNGLLACVNYVIWCLNLALQAEVVFLTRAVKNLFSITTKYGYINRLSQIHSLQKLFLNQENIFMFLRIKFAYYTLQNQYRTPYRNKSA